MSGERGARRRRLGGAGLLLLALSGTGLADELSVGLAPVIVDKIFEALAVLRAEGRSVLLVEQYLERAVAIADYVYILQEGDVVFMGEPSQCACGVVFARYLGASA